MAPDDGTREHTTEICNWEDEDTRVLGTLQNLVDIIILWVAGIVRGLALAEIRTMLIGAEIGNSNHTFIPDWSTRTATLLAAHHTCMGKLYTCASVVKKITLKIKNNRI